MLSKDEFVRRILDGAPPESEAEADAGFGDAMLEGFDAFDVPEDAEESTTDARFAQLLLEESGFGRGETLPRGEVVLGDQKTNRFLPNAATYWAKTTARPFHILLFDLEIKGSAILGDRFFKQNDQLEDALHRIVQDALEGFERGGEGRTADRKKGAQAETLCVVSVIDDRRDGPERQIVCFGTKCTETDALEVFTLREEARDWERPLAEEHLGQLFERHFKRLGTGARWQDAFVSGEERKKARKLMDECARLIPDEKQLQTAIRELLDEIAGSFGLRRKGGRGGHRLVMHALPEDHSIAVDPEDARQTGFKNPFQGLRIFDADERLIGYIVYVLDKKSEAERLHRQLAQHNHFHNVLVVYPEKAEATLELWQGTEPLRGRLISGTRRSRFDGEGGVVQLLSRFFVVSRSAISTPAQLATELAWRAQHLKALAIDELHKEENKPKDQRPLRDLLDVFNQALATLDETQFADAYAQTITYGLLAARWLSSGRQDVRFARKNIDALLPSTSPFLHDLFQRLVNSRFDQNLSWLLDDITSLLSRTMVAEVFQGEDDPSIHFYQDFLDAYDPRLRSSRGVYYTPDEVVDFIVRSAHESLQKSFGLVRGLADTSTWAEVCQRIGIDLPNNVSPDAPFVQILDPATGTGTFLKHVIELIYDTMMTEWEGAEWQRNRQAATLRHAEKWSTYVRAHLLPRLNGFEIMMAPYIVSHLRLGLALEETGFVFDEQTRLRVFLTNALEPHASKQLELIGDHVAEEAQAASTAKLQPGISVVVGNPPYSVTSQNRGAWISELLNDFKKGLSERKLNLDDDFVKFLRYASYRVEQVGVGIVGLVTNHIFLSAVTHRQIRRHLLDRFNSIRIADLHGDSRYGEDVPVGRANENVFNIQQGVAAFQLVSTGQRDSKASVAHADVWGSREEKLTQLNESSGIEFLPLSPSAPNFMLFPRELRHEDLYLSWPSVNEWFTVHTNGIETHRDDVTVHYGEDDLEAVLELLRTNMDVEQVRKRLGTKKDGRDWHLVRAMECVRLSEGTKGLITYRPFDVRHTYWHPGTKGFLAYPRWEVAGPALGVKANLILATARLKARGGEWDSAVVSRYPTEKKTADSTRSSAFFPLYLSGDATLADKGRRANLATKYLQAIRTEAPDATERDVFFYLVAVLHSPEYRAMFEPQLSTGFPRVPVPHDRALFAELSELGAEISQAFLLEVSPPSGLAAFVGTNRTIKRVAEPKQRLHAVKSGVGVVRINDESRFTGIPETAWHLRVGGYQPCHKWLNDRKKDGKSLSDDDVAQYRRVVASCQSIVTARDRVDSAVARHGGWPNAFVGGDA